KAQGLIADQYASVSAAARTVLPAALNVLDGAAARGLDVTELAARTQQRLVNAETFRTAYTSYVTPANGPDEVTFAPFQILAGEGERYARRPHAGHLEQLATLDHPAVVPTRHRWVDLADAQSRADAVQWWNDLTGAGGEGMVVKPEAPEPRNR